jgi:hypothetical protein
LISVTRVWDSMMVLLCEELWASFILSSTILRCCPGMMLDQHGSPQVLIPWTGMGKRRGVHSLEVVYITPVHLCFVLEWVPEFICWSLIVYLVIKYGTFRRWLRHQGRALMDDGCYSLEVVCPSRFVCWKLGPCVAVLNF